MEFSILDFEADIKVEMDDTGLDIALECIMDKIKLLQLRLTATRSYVEILQKQLNEAIELEQELEKQLNGQLDDEVNVRNIMLLNRAMHDQNKPSPVVNLQNQQTLQSNESLSYVPMVKEELLESKLATGLALANQNQYSANVTVFDQCLNTGNVNAGLCGITSTTSACSEIIDKSHASCTISEPSNSSLKQYVCQTCGSSFVSAKSLRLHIKISCRDWPQLPLSTNRTTTDNDQSCQVEDSASAADVIKKPFGKRRIYKCPVCQVYCSTNQGTITRHVRSKICQATLNSEQVSPAAKNNENKNVLIGALTINTSNVSEFGKRKLPSVLHQCPTCQLCYQSERGLQVHLIAKCQSKKMLQAMVKKRAYVRKQDITKRIIRPRRPNFVRAVTAADCDSQQMLSPSDEKISVQDLVTSSVQTCEILSSSCFACGIPNVTEWSSVHTKTNRVCLDCEKLFLDQYVLDSSQYAGYIERSDTKKRYICLTCKKGFGLIRTILLHLRSHAGYKPCVCYRCGRAYSLPISLKLHLLVHDQEDSRVYFKCDICLKQFHTETRLKLHKLTHSDKKSFVCSVCGKAYAIGYELQIHMRNHSGVRPYVCNICPKTFMMACHLKKHMNNNHSDRKPEPCPVCFKEVFNLSRHHKEIHLGIMRKKHLSRIKTK